MAVATFRAPAVPPKYREKGLRFKSTGHPDFEPYAVTLPNGKKTVKIELTGSRRADEALANAPRTFKRRFGGGGRGRLAGADGAGVPGGPPSVRLPTFGRRQGRRVHADRCPVGGRGGQGEATRGRARRARPGVGHGRVQTLRARRGGRGW